MSPFKTMSEDEVQRINELQREIFDKVYRLFEPPLPEGVPERLERIVASGQIKKGATVLDVGSGTGIMVPLIREYEPARICACDLTCEICDYLMPASTWSSSTPAIPTSWTRRPPSPTSAGWSHPEGVW
jgi:2-polyprenyl-3-methyl-5-hydroxy-6-metoxy-1,4-benzoquinol methylase